MTHRMRRAFVLCLLLPVAASAQQARYRNPDLPTAERVADLIGRMTLEEKVGQLMDNAPAIPRLNVPEYGWWNEALHGVGRAGLATVFPQAIGMAATWNDSLMLRMATVISDEARAKHHEFARNGRRLRYQGLTIFSPNINIFRDPRWGRGQETYGEDPFLTGQLGVQFIRGLQGDDPRYFKTVATVKHFAVHSGPEPERHAFDVAVNARDLRETYLPHFEQGIRQAGAWSLMCAYNRVFGKAACASDQLERDILRGEWKFGGYIVSDCGAIDDIFQHHKLVPTAAEASALALKLGTDLECGRSYRSLVEAVQKNLVSERDIDVALTRLFTARFRLGMFDPPERVKWAQIPYSVVDQPSHRALARRVARESIVLLKNARNTLPLRKDLGTIAVIGPNADDWMMLLGNYNGMPADPVTPLRGIREAVSSRTRVLHARGSEIADSLPSFDIIPRAALGRGLRAEFFANAELSGTPLYSTTDSVLNANWSDRSPRTDLNVDDFSVRWSGELRPTRTGRYQLGLIGTMKYALYLNDSLIVRSVYGFRDEFGDPRLRAGTAITLEQGKVYRLRIEANETYGEAQLQLVWTDPARDLIGEAVRVAQQADAVVLFLGLTPRVEGEEMDVRIPGFRGGDRTSIDLPAPQQRLLERITAIGKPTVLVLLNGSAVAINWAQQNVPAILEAWYPGQAGGSAIADVLFGDYNPGGRLPVTFYKSTADLPPFEDYAMRNRTYRFFTGEPLYPFGHGLSYTTFAYQDLRMSRESLAENGTLNVSVTVANTGRRAGDEVVQLYIQHLGSRLTRPLKELKGYTRITLQPGERKTVSFPLAAAQVAYWDSTAHRWSLEPGRVRVMLGASSADIRLSDTITVNSSAQEAALRLPRLFQDGMVLQRQAPIAVWGWSAPGASIRVDLSGATARATADASGAWSAQLPMQQAGGPHTLNVSSGASRLIVRDVLIGDVWIASGQSNMAWTLTASTNGAATAAAANDAKLREFTVPRTWAESPQADLQGGKWLSAEAGRAGQFSGVAYFFARELRASTGVPIGIIHTSWGGSNIETWISRGAQGIDANAWSALIQSERTRDAAVLDTLRMRIGSNSLPTTDAGMVNGRALWADPQFDDARWANVRVPSLWESAGFPGLDGVAWYRTTVTLTQAEANAGARISLGMIDDDDITWINGVEVGRTSGYAEKRSYHVPATALRAGANLIAIRIVDGTGGGGPYGDSASFFLETTATKHSLARDWKFKVAVVAVQADGQRINKIPSVLYNQMLYPILRYPIKGVIWYQGESNANNDAQANAYRPLFAKLIQSWRSEWQGASSRDFPFLWVQLPNFGAIDRVPPTRASWALLRESQEAALSLPNTGQAVAIDVGDPGDIHPRDKEPVGKRLALVARKIAYGEKIVASGPTYRSHSIRGNEVVIEFDNIGGGLVSRTGENVRGFAIAGADQQWAWANARIDGKRVIVSSPQVSAPVAVRYAWGNSPGGLGLYNREGLPAGPVSTLFTGTH